MTIGADRVGHHVVQLARDPRPLLGHREPCLLLALALEPRRVTLELAATRPQDPRRVAEHPRHSQEPERADVVPDTLEPGGHVRYCHAKHHHARRR